MSIFKVQIEKPLAFFIYLRSYVLGLSMRTFSNSLGLKIALAYITLAIFNLAYFSISTIDNQTDLIYNNFKAQANNLAQKASSNFSQIKLGSNKKSKGYKYLKEQMELYDLNWYKITNSNGDILYEKHIIKKEEETKVYKYIREQMAKYGLNWGEDHEINQDKKADSNNKKEGNILKKDKEKDRKEMAEKIQLISSTKSLLKANYLVELQKEDFSIRMILPITKSQNSFLYTSLNLSSVQDRKNAVYYQIAMSILWGVIFHALFAVFLSRAIFRRISILVNASKKMKDGDLSTRATWKIKENKEDELDILGTSFNEMAHSVQEKVRIISEQIKTISTLNSQIQLELQIGKNVQELLITPNTDVIKEFSPYSYYHPLREVSGDMMHCFNLGNIKGVFFADASGHGVPAALVTAITFLSLETIIKSNVPKEELLAKLNNEIATRMQQAFYLTAVILLFDPNNGKLWYTNAGHNSFFLSLKNGEMQVIDSICLPVGVLPDAEYPLTSFDVSEGDRIFLYTDGLTETMDDAKEEFGIERLTKIIEDNKSLSSNEMGDKIKEDFTNFARNYIDDVTFLSLDVPASFTKSVKKV